MGRPPPTRAFLPIQPHCPQEPGLTLLRASWHRTRVRRPGGHGKQPTCDRVYRNERARSAEDDAGRRRPAAPRLGDTALHKGPVLGHGPLPEDGAVGPRHSGHEGAGGGKAWRERPRSAGLSVPASCCGPALGSVPGSFFFLVFSRKSAIYKTYYRY